MIETVKLISSSPKGTKILPRVILQDTSELIVNLQQLYLKEPVCSFKFEWGDGSDVEVVKADFFTEDINNVKYYNVSWDQEHTYNPSSTNLIRSIVCQVMVVYCSGKYAQFFIPISIYSPSFFSRIGDLSLIKNNYLGSNESDIMYTLHTQHNDQVIELVSDKTVNQLVKVSLTGEEPDATTTLGPFSPTTTSAPTTTTTTTTTIAPLLTCVSCVYYECLTGSPSWPVLSGTANESLTANCSVNGVVVPFNCDTCECEKIAATPPCPFSNCSGSSYPEAQCPLGFVFDCETCTCIPSCEDAQPCNPIDWCPNPLSGEIPFILEKGTCKCICPTFNCTGDNKYPIIDCTLVMGVTGYYFDCDTCSCQLI